MQEVLQKHKSLEDEGYNGQPLDAENDQLRVIIKADLLTSTREVCWRTQHLPFYGYSAFEANWEGEKSSISGCLMSWLKIKKFKVLSSLTLCNNNKPFLNQIVHVTESVFYRTTSDDQFTKEALKQVPKPNLQQKKVVVTVWWCLIHYSFLNPS